MTESLFSKRIFGIKTIYILIILVVILVPSAFAYNYFATDPRACNTCHLMSSAYDTWDHSAMHDIDCHSCHPIPSPLVSIDHIIKVIFSNQQEVMTIAEVENEDCETCHVSDDPNWFQIAETVGHEVHFFESQEQPDCIDCHGLQLHVFEPPEETCNECHDETLAMDPEELNTHCIVCHEFTATTELLRPERSECLTCHPEMSITKVSFPTGAHENTTCIVCHNPHTTEEYTPCISCHEVISNGLHNVESHSLCETCHKPHSTEEFSSTCLSCHTDRKDHFPGISCETCH